MSESPKNGPKNERHVLCPRCGKPALFSAANTARPFCSERCKMIDLGNWADESYAIPVAGSAQPAPGEDSESSDESENDSQSGAQEADDGSGGTNQQHH